MKKIKQTILNHKIYFTILTLIIIFNVYYAKLPDYETHHSFKISSRNYVETTLDIQVYKAFNNKYLYLEIAEEHNRINGQPNILKMNLYFFKWKYKTVIFNYDENLYYIKLEY